VERLHLTPKQKSLLIELKRAKIVMFGKTIRTKYGLNSPIYLDLREHLYERADLIWRIGGEFAEKIRALTKNPQSQQTVIGVPDTATPLALSTVLYSSREETGPPMHYLLLRNEGKVYGSNSPSHLIGKKRDGDCEYNLIDDVVASGLSKWKSLQTLEGEGITVQRIIAFFDRQQGGAELLEKEGYAVDSVFSLLDVTAFYLQEGLITEATHRQIQEFIRTHRFEKPLWE
jgi:uridine monophosphate synthetase